MGMKKAAAEGAAAFSFQAPEGLGGDQMAKSSIFLPVAKAA